MANLLDDLGKDDFKDMDRFIRKKKKSNQGLGMYKRDFIGQLKRVSQENQGPSPSDSSKNLKRESQNESSVPKTSQDKNSTPISVSKSTQDDLSTASGVPKTSQDENSTPSGVSDSTQDDFGTVKQNFRFNESNTNPGKDDGILEKKASEKEIKRLKGGFVKNQVDDSIVPLTPNSKNVNNSEIKLSVSKSTQDDLSTANGVPKTSQDENSTLVGVPDSTQDDFGTEIKAILNPIFPLGDNTPHKFFFTRGYVRFPDSHLKDTASLSRAGKRLYRYLYAISYGYGSDKTKWPVAVRHIIKYTSLASSSVQKALKELKSIRLIQPERDLGNIGTVYTVFYSRNGGLISDFPSQQYFRLCFDYFKIRHLLTDTEENIYFLLYRLSYGHQLNVTNTYISTQDIVKAISISDRNTKNAMRSLEKKKFIKKIDQNTDYQFLFRVFLPHEVYQINSTSEFIIDDVVSGESVPKSSRDKNSTLNGVSKSTQDDFLIRDEKSTQDDLSTQTIFNMSFPVVKPSVPKTSQDENSTSSKRSYLSKTSSKDDDFFDFISHLKSMCGDANFSRLNISQNKWSKWIKNYSKEGITKIFENYSNYIFSSGVTNPTGLLCDLLKNPGDYSIYPGVRQQNEHQNQLEIDDRKKRKKEKIREIISRKINEFWAQLPGRDRDDLVAKSEDEIRAKFEDHKIKPNDSVIQNLAIEEAKKRHFKTIEGD